MAAHGKNKTWVSDHVKTESAFRRKSDMRKRVIKGYPQLDHMPHSQAEEVQLTSDILKAKAAYLSRKLKQDQEVTKHKWNIPIAPFKGKYSREIKPVPRMETLLPDATCYQYPGPVWTMQRFGKADLFHRSMVLAQPTIWLPPNQGQLSNKNTISSASGLWLHELEAEKPDWPADAVHESLEAGWPCAQELKYEGDDRVATDVKHGRFLPVPRRPGNDTVNWQQLSFLEQHPFDLVFCGGNRKKHSEEEVFWSAHDVSFVVPLVESDFVEVLGETYEETRARINPFGETDAEIERHLVSSDLMEALEPEGIYDVHQDF